MKTKTRWMGLLAATVLGCGSSADGTGNSETTGTSAAELESAARTHGLTVTNLVADQKGVAQNVDPNLVNAWGLAFNPTAGFAWVSDNGTGLSTVYDTTGALKLTVEVPGVPKTEGPSNPTGVVFNPTSAFHGDRFIFVTEDGEISGWAPGRGALPRFNASKTATYKGVTLAITEHGHPRLYAANFKTGMVDMYAHDYKPVFGFFAFVDFFLPPNYVPFNVMAVGREVFVAFAEADAEHHDEVAGPGKGFIDAFDTEGHFLRRVASRGALNAPWGMAIAPSSWGRLAGMLLVGNFGDGKIHAFDPWSCRHEGALVDTRRRPIVIDGLWALEFGVGEAASTLFFTAGPDDEQHGLFGRIDMR